MVQIPTLLRLDGSVIKPSIIAAAPTGFSARRRALLAFCAGLLGALLAYLASPPQAITTRHSLDAGFHRMIER
jgi:hypothetical protein